MKAIWSGVCAGALLAVSACASTGENEEREARNRYLPPMPAMPSLPTIKVSDLRIPGTQRTAPVVDPDLEPVIYWRVIADDILIVHADSRGCTARSDFLVNVRQYDHDVFTVSLDRAVADLCDADVPWGMQLGFGFEELGVPPGGQIVVLNPLDDRPWDWAPRRIVTAQR